MRCGRPRPTERARSRRGSTARGSVGAVAGSEHGSDPTRATNGRRQEASPRSTGPALEVSPLAMLPEETSRDRAPAAPSGE